MWEGFFYERRTATEEMNGDLRKKIDITNGDLRKKSNMTNGDLRKIMYKSPVMWYTIYLYQQTSDTQNTYEINLKEIYIP